MHLLKIDNNVNSQKKKFPETYKMPAKKALVLATSYLLASIHAFWPACINFHFVT